MCFHPMMVKMRKLPHSTQVDPRAISDTFVPCGKCQECRKSKAMSWQWRLNAEMWSLRERTDCVWSFAFITLTYGTPKGGYARDMVPTVPVELFTDPARYTEIQCFNKSHVQEFFKDIRKALHKSFWIGRKKALKLDAVKNPHKYERYKNHRIYEDSNLRYICCAEYGGEKGRPHYHAILAYPLVNGLTPERMFTICQDMWSKKHGFMFPKNLNGGLNNGRTEKPFTIDVSALSKSLAYVSKYVCKDMAFGRKVASAPIDRSARAFRNCDCFHLQSRSLGLSVIKNMTEGQKVDLFVNGYCFKDCQEKGYQPIPAYIRDKLIFDLDYVYEPCTDSVKYSDFYDEDGIYHSCEIVSVPGFKRLVRKEANDFFKAHYKEVFQKQKRFYRQLFADMLKESFWTERQVEQETAKKLTASNRNILNCVSLEALADWFIGFYRRVPGTLVNVPPERSFLARYDVDTFNSLCDYELLEPAYCRSMDDLCHCYLGSLRFIVKRKSWQEEDFDNLSHQIKEAGLYET